MTRISAEIMEQEVGRYRCTTDDGRNIDVIEYQYLQKSDTGNGTRIYPGARRLVTAKNETVHYIDENVFEIIDTGTLIQRQN